ncbi:MAG: YchJ family protein [Chromatiales bacterium]|jgi:SEC-C motif domain protein|nr:YchJ family protein [Chromatiales bacterium]
MENNNAPCPCGSAFALAACCAPFIAGIGAAPSAEALMRSRYSAYVIRNAAYLLESWHASTRPPALKLDAAQRWLSLEIRRTHQGAAGDKTGTVEFVARYKLRGRRQEIHEISRFRAELGRWYYVDGIFPNV